MKRFIQIFLIFSLIIPTACNNNPKVIQANSDQPSSSSGIFTENTESNTTASAPMSDGFTEHLHSIVAQEILPTKKYVYVKALENGKTFWIASRKQDIAIGETYYYRSALLKTNFESKEHSRMFDSIYLVSNLVNHDHGKSAGMVANDFSSEENTLETTVSTKQEIPMHTEKIIPQKGSITIAELVSDPASFEGKTVQLTGKVVKVNPNIMNRNWLHLQDGTKNDYDLVITSNTFVPEGKEVTIKGLVQLNRDFGAGYRYDLILENGIVVQ